MSHKILIVDDEVTAVNNLAYVCEKEGYQVTTRTAGIEAIEVMNKEYFDVILTDLKMENVDGIAVLNAAKQLNSHVAVILITGHATLDSAVEAMKLGAFHYIAKPFRLDEVREVLRKAIEMVSLKNENQKLKEQLSNNQKSTSIITQDEGMKKLLEMARQIASANINVLITGDSGTGKELLAKYVHGCSSRTDQRFYAVNCGALQEDLLANELFGHEKGAYTGAYHSKKGIIESSSGGTLFLDEIAEMSLGMQVKLLRVIQEREIQRIGSTEATPVDIRLITATHRNLQEEVKQGRFRKDLYYRLNVVEMAIPPLSKRHGDVILLAFYFLQKYNHQMGKEIDDIDAAVIKILSNYDYPGNVRELENIIERAVTLSCRNKIMVTNLPPTLLTKQQPKAEIKQGVLLTLAERESRYIEYVLQKSGDNKTKAAKILGIDRVSLWRKLKNMGYN